MAKRFFLATCVALTVLMAGCADNDNVVVSSDATSSDTVSSVTVSSEPPSSESPSSEIISSVAVSSLGDKKNDILFKSEFFEKRNVKPKSPLISSEKKFTSPLVKWQERPVSGTASSDWKISYDTATFNKENDKGIFDVEGDPVYSPDHSEFTSFIEFKKGTVDYTAPAAFYRNDSGKWVLLNEKAANLKTKPQYYNPPGENLAYDIRDKFNGVLTKTGKYMMEKQINGKLVSIKFSYVSREDWKDNFMELSSTNATISLDKETFPIGTNQVTVILATNNGSVSGGFQYSLDKYNPSNGEWESLYSPVPTSLGTLYPKDGSYKQSVSLGDHLNEVGTYKLNVSYNEQIKNEMIFTVE